MQDTPPVFDKREYRRTRRARSRNLKVFGIVVLVTLALAGAAYVLMPRILNAVGTSE